MKLPSAGQIATEAALVIAGALLAAWLIGQAPPVRDWIRRQWGTEPARCDCARP